MLNSHNYFVAKYSRSWILNFFFIHFWKLNFYFHFVCFYFQMHIICTHSQNDLRIRNCVKENWLCALTIQDKREKEGKKINKQMKHLVSRAIKLIMGEKKAKIEEKKKHLKQEKTKKHKNNTNLLYHFNKAKIDFYC